MGFTMFKVSEDNHRYIVLQILTETATNSLNFYLLLKTSYHAFIVSENT